MYVKEGIKHDRSQNYLHTVYNITNTTNTNSLKHVLCITHVYFCLFQIFISLICALITTPPVMLLIFLFKRTTRKPSSSSGCCACCRCSCNCWSRCCCVKKKSDTEIKYEEALKSRILSEEVPDFGGGFFLPSW